MLERKYLSLNSGKTPFMWFPNFVTYLKGAQNKCFFFNSKTMPLGKSYSRRGRRYPFHEKLKGWMSHQSSGCLLHRVHWVGACSTGGFIVEIHLGAWHLSCTALQLTDTSQAKQDKCYCLSGESTNAFDKYSTHSPETLAVDLLHTV